MADRILLGKARYTSGGSDNYGLWISKPGTAVFTTVSGNAVLCDKEDMLFDTNLDYGQILAKGNVSSATNISVTVRSGVSPFTVAKGYSGTTIQTRNTTAGDLAWFSANASDVTITYSSGTVTITPTIGTANYIIFQGTT